MNYGVDAPFGPAIQRRMRRGGSGLSDAGLLHDREPPGELVLRTRLLAAMLRLRT